MQARARFGPHLPYSLRLQRAFLDAEALWSRTQLLRFNIKPQYRMTSSLNIYGIAPANKAIIFAPYGRRTLVRRAVYDWR